VGGASIKEGGCWGVFLEKIARKRAGTVATDAAASDDRRRKKSSGEWELKSSAADSKKRSGVPPSCQPKERSGVISTSYSGGLRSLKRGRGLHAGKGYERRSARQSAHSKRESEIL